jgi:type IV pilus assembly protein PilV
MLVAGITSSNKSLYRSSAVYMANEISERMRSNIAGVKANAYVGVGSSSKICRTSPGTPTPSICSSAELAAYDVYDWNTQIARLLPGGTGTVLNTNGLPWASNQNQYEITVTWLEDKTNATQMNFKLRFEP